MIQRGHLVFFNNQFGKIFGYSPKEISKWKKREFYCIVHPEDLHKLIQSFEVEDSENAIVQFRGIKKTGEIIPIENSVCTLKYNDINAYLSTYSRLDKVNDKKVKCEINKKEDLETQINNIKIFSDYHPELITFLKEKQIKFEAWNLIL